MSEEEVAAKVSSEFAKYPLRKYPKGQILVFGGENPGKIFYLTKGRVRMYDVSYRGDELVINLYKPPAYFPMSWALNRIDNKYFYKTETAVELRAVPVDEAYEFIKNNPDVALDLLARLYRGLEGLFGRVVNLMSASAKDRLIYELVIESRRFGEKQDDGSLLLRINEGDLAARSGLSRETISREIKSLKSAKLVGVSTNKIVIKDLSSLEQKIGFTS
jgi:CRP/FNR family transcriptional regulator